MTNQDLTQIYYLNGEVRIWQNELSRLECQSLVKGQDINGMPFGKGISDKVGNLATDKSDIETIIKGKKAEIEIKRKQIIEFINSIDDSMLRQIFYYRCISCMDWNEVADNIGGNNTSSGVKSKYHRYLKKCNTCNDTK